MEYLKFKCLTRIENFLQNLNNALFMIKENLNSLELDEDMFLKLDNEEDLVDYVSSLLVKYVISVCEGENLSDSQVIDDIEESVEAQKLVEFECSEIYKSRVSLILKNLISCRMSLYKFLANFEETHEGVLNTNTRNNKTVDLFITTDILSTSENPLYSKTEVSKFLKIRTCCLALEFISDLPLKLKHNKNDTIKDKSSISNEQCQELYVVINYKTHGIMVLRRFVALCTSVCPLKTEVHTLFLKNHLSHTGPTKRLNLRYLHCSRPWIVYWTLHSLALLGEDLSPYKERSINTLMSFWDPVFGGFAGGEGQRGHLATTYSALCVLKMFNSLEVVNSEKLYSFLMDMKMDNGSFSSTYGEETDSRSTYCAIASAHIMGLLTQKLTEKTAEFLQSCQTFEGGLSAEPYLEAHAGYTYCGLSAMSILGELRKLDLNKLYHWAMRRLTSQLGFQGRPHKLVDSCYSFWIGGCLEILNVYSDHFFPVNNNNNESQENKNKENNQFVNCIQNTIQKTGKQKKLRLYEQLLRCYLLVVSQTEKGFRDKPTKHSDLYHTCYSLSYLNIINPITDRKYDILLNLVEL